MNEPAFSTDVIVGFPGETEADFERTLETCEAAGFMKIHVFPFSPRRGTPAANMLAQYAQRTIMRGNSLGDGSGLKCQF